MKIHQDRTQDHLLTAAELDAKYNPDGDGEHPDYPRAEWRAAVSQQYTISGYWDWVVYRANRPPLEEDQFERARRKGFRGQFTDTFGRPINPIKRKRKR